MFWLENGFWRHFYSIDHNDILVNWFNQFLICVYWFCSFPPLCNFDYSFNHLVNTNLNNIDRYVNSFLSRPSIVSLSSFCYQRFYGIMQRFLSVAVGAKCCSDFFHLCFFYVFHTYFFLFHPFNFLNFVFRSGKILFILCPCNKYLFLKLVLIWSLFERLKSRGLKSNINNITWIKTTRTTNKSWSER